VKIMAIFINSLPISFANCFLFKIFYIIDKLGRDKLNSIGEKCSDFGFWHIVLLWVFLVALGGLSVLLKLLLFMVWFRKTSGDNQTKAPQTRDFQAQAIVRDPIYQTK
jgi:predicted membrane protein